MCVSCTDTADRGLPNEQMSSNNIGNCSCRGGCLHKLYVHYLHDPSTYRHTNTRLEAALPEYAKEDVEGACYTKNTSVVLQRDHQIKR